LTSARSSSEATRSNKVDDGNDANDVVERSPVAVPDSDDDMGDMNGLVRPCRELRRPLIGFVLQR
jgi:hypothetical protein